MMMFTYPQKPITCLVLAGVLLLSISLIVQADDAKDLANSLDLNSTAKSVGEVLIGGGDVNSMDGNNTAEISEFGLSKDPDTDELEEIANDPEKLEAAGQAMMDDPLGEYGDVPLNPGTHKVCFDPNPDLKAYNDYYSRPTTDPNHPTCSSVFLAEAGSCTYLSTKSTGKTVTIIAKPNEIALAGQSTDSCALNVDQRVSGYYEKSASYEGSAKICVATEEGVDSCTGSYNPAHAPYENLLDERDQIIVAHPACSVSYTRQHYYTRVSVFSTSTTTDWSRPVAEEGGDSSNQSGESSTKYTTWHNGYKHFAKITCTDLPITHNAYGEFKAKPVTITAENTGEYRCEIPTGDYKYFDCAVPEGFEMSKTVECAVNPRDGFIDHPPLCIDTLKPTDGCILDSEKDVNAPQRFQVDASDYEQNGYYNCETKTTTADTFSGYVSGFHVWEYVGHRMAEAVIKAAADGYGSASKHIHNCYSWGCCYYITANLSNVPVNWSSGGYKASDITSSPYFHLTSSLTKKEYYCDKNVYAYREKRYQCPDIITLPGSDTTLNTEALNPTNPYCVVTKINSETGKTDTFNKACFNNQCPLEAGESISINCTTQDRTAEEFGDATSQLKIADSIGKQVSALAASCNGSPDCIVDNLRLFPGEKSKCRSWKLYQVPQTNCCEDAWDFCIKVDEDYHCYKVCSEEDARCQDMREEGSSVKIGSYQNEDCCCRGTPLESCWKTETYNSYCIFDNPLAKLLQVAGRSQLGISWGSARDPNCRGFTLDEFTKIDFGKVDFTPFIKELGLDKEGVLKAISEYMENLR